MKLTKRQLKRIIKEEKDKLKAQHKGGDFDHEGYITMDDGGGSGSNASLKHAVKQPKEQQELNTGTQQKSLGNFMDTFGLHVGNPWPKDDRNEQRKSTDIQRRQQSIRPNLPPIAKTVPLVTFNQNPFRMERTGVSNRAINMARRAKGNLYGRRIKKESVKEKDKKRSEDIHNLLKDMERKEGGKKKTKRKRRKKKKTRRKSKRKKKTRKRIKRKKRTRRK